MFRGWTLDSGSEREVLIIEICKYMGWDWHTYRAQPLPFLQSIVIRMSEEGRQQKQQQRQKKH